MGLETLARAYGGIVRSHLRYGPVDHALRAIAKVGYAARAIREPPTSIAVERDVVYAPPGDAAHRLDVYVPTKASRPMPVVMYVHGGGFAMLSKETHRVMAVPIASAGNVVFNVNYRLGPWNTYPKPLEDVAAALLWVKEHCARWGGDPTRIAIAGESAGGNLVTALAVASSYRLTEPFARAVFDADLALRAVVSTYGFLDLGFAPEYAKRTKIPAWARSMVIDSARAYLGHDIEAAAAAFPLASPLKLLEQLGPPDRPLPPFFASVGTRDPLITCSRRLKAAIDAKGGVCELHISPGEIHGFDAFTWRPAAREKWRATVAFLREHLAP